MVIGGVIVAIPVPRGSKAREPSSGKVAQSV